MAKSFHPQKSSKQTNGHKMKSPIPTFPRFSSPEICAADLVLIGVGASVRGRRGSTTAGPLAAARTDLTVIGRFVALQGISIPPDYHSVAEVEVDIHPRRLLRDK
jgi:hypothetical protein